MCSTRLGNTTETNPKENQTKCVQQDTERVQEVHGRIWKMFIAASDIPEACQHMFHLFAFFFWHLQFAQKWHHQEHYQQFCEPVIHSNWEFLQCSRSISIWEFANNGIARASVPKRAELLEEAHHLIVVWEIWQGWRGHGQINFKKYFQLTWDCHKTCQQFISHKSKSQGTSILSGSTVVEEAQGHPKLSHARCGHSLEHILLAWVRVWKALNVVLQSLVWCRVIQPNYF